MELMKYVSDNTLVLIPMLYILGLFLKGMPHFSDKYIPLALILVGVCMSIRMNGVDQGIIQGILAAGAAVLGNQTVKQLTTRKEDDSAQ